MSLVARLDVAVRVHAYRAGLSMPALVLGVLPMVVGVLTNRGLVVVWAQFFLLECFTDLGTLFATLGVPARAWVRSHPHGLGCETVASESGSVGPFGAQGDAQRR